MGAVNVVVAPLAVCAGENEPQAGALPQVAIQSTPAFATSLFTVADTVTLPPMDMVAGGVRMRDTEIIGVADDAVCALVEQLARPRTIRMNAATGNKTLWQRPRTTFVIKTGPLLLDCLCTGRRTHMCQVALNNRNRKRPSESFFKGPPEDFFRVGDARLG